MGDGVKRRTRLHRSHCRTYDSGLIPLWLAYAMGRPTTCHPPDDDMMANGHPPHYFVNGHIVKL
jgi:hypothetical protein